MLNFSVTVFLFCMPEHPITSSNKINYTDTVKLIIKEDGISGLFGRGLKTRILTNGIQGIVFTISWKWKS